MSKSTNDPNPADPIEHVRKAAQSAARGAVGAGPVGPHRPADSQPPAGSHGYRFRGRLHSVAHDAEVTA